MRSILLLVLAPLTAAGVVLAAPTAPTAPTAKKATKTVEVVDAWARATPPGASVAAGYFTVKSTGPADKLVSVSSPAASSVELHKMSMKGGVMKMEPAAGGIDIPAGGSITLAPGGTHVMFTGLKQPFVEKATVPITLHFQKAGAVDVELAVLSMGAQGPKETK